MNLQKMIAELQAERDRLDDAILALERLSSSHSKRRGRPPQWLKAAAAAGSEGRDHRTPYLEHPAETGH